MKSWLQSVLVLVSLFLSLSVRLSHQLFSLISSLRIISRNHSCRSLYNFLCMNNRWFNRFISAGIIFCHFNKSKTKNLKNDDLPIPPGGKGLNDKTRPLNDLGAWFHLHREPEIQTVNALKYFGLENYKLQSRIRIDSTAFTNIAYWWYKCGTSLFWSQESYRFALYPGV